MLGAYFSTLFSRPLIFIRPISAALNTTFSKACFDVEISVIFQILLLSAMLYIRSLIYLNINVAAYVVCALSPSPHACRCPRSLRTFVLPAPPFWATTRGYAQPKPRVGTHEQAHTTFAYNDRTHTHTSQHNLDLVYSTSVVLSMCDANFQDTVTAYLLLF